MGARSYVLAVSASILVSLVLAGTAAAAPPQDSTDSFIDPFLLESDYLWTSNTAGYTTFDGEPRTASNPASTFGDCGPTEMHATSWWQIHGTGRHTFISTSWDHTNTNYDTVMAVYEEGVGGSIGTFVGCVDDVNINSDLGSIVDLNTTNPNKDYLIQVGGVGGATGTLQIFASSDVPSNDDRAQAEPVSVGPQSFWENFGATPVDVDADCQGTPYGKTVWFRYTSPERGNAAFDVVSSFNTVIGVYRGSDAGALACGNNLGTTTARAETGDQNADTYYLQVGNANDHDDYFLDDFDADEGFFGVEVKFTPDPDDDDDGVLDGQDRCPLVKGTGLVKDCPDPDSDGFADGFDDRCNGLGGRDAGKYQGCPDADQDGVPEGGQDRCPNLSPALVGRADKNTDGCPDILALHKRVDLSRSVLLARGGIILEFFRVRGVPAGARVKVVCRRPGGARCGGKTVRSASPAKTRAKAAKTITAKIDRRLPFGTTITTRTTAAYATGSFIRFKVARNAKGFTQKYFCMNYGSRTLRPRSRGCQ